MAVPRLLSAAEAAAKGEVTVDLGDHWLSVIGKGGVRAGAAYACV